MTPEEWRTVPTAPGYEASSLGRVRNARTLHVLKPLRHDKGYLKVKLGRARYDYVHRIVCEAFHGEPPSQHVHDADHKDFDRENNRPANLRWLPKHLNAWRWDGYRDPVEDEPFEPITEAEGKQLDAAMAKAGW
ncbi:NUMOD4 motif-containing HNH endonuclease [Occultella glacieicola]|uniref:NUMOD4 motif-containing HNH endonuclease n=1 Tax=Occultella glacieicola TaxID=2518684 RepID=UPI0022A8C658|nr:NUMOD4 motif-containing HNH endonuclease [Occultella glacieicola]